MNKKKILFVSSFVVGGGAAKVLLNIINSLPLEGYDMRLLVISTKPGEYYYVKEGVEVFFCDRTRALDAVGDVYQNIRDFEPDYIFCTDYFSYLLPIFKLFSKKPFKIFSRVNVPPSEYPINDIKVKMTRVIQYITYRFTDCIISQTEFMKQDLISWFHIKPDKIRVIRNIIDTEMLTRKGSEDTTLEMDDKMYNILAAGALYPVKGFDLLISAVEKVKDLIPDLRLTIIGKERYNANYRETLQDLINEKGLKDIVLLAGHKENPYPYFKKADLFVLSSRTEAFPNVVLESLFFGTPVVATQVVDFSGVIQEGVNGYVVERESPDAIAEGIMKSYRELNKPCNFVYKNFDYTKLFLR